MNTSEAIRARRSIRKFKSGAEIPKKDIEMMLEAAMMAPSAMNSRPWAFVVVETQAKRVEIARVHPHAQMVIDASIAIVVCGKLDTLGEGMPEFWPQDCGAAIENILLQAVELGYGAVWCGVYPNKGRVESIRQVVGTEAVPVAVIAVGISDEQPNARGFYDSKKVKYV